MKIWVVGRNYPGKGNNGQGSFELEQAKMLAKRGNEVTYLACLLHPFWRIKEGGLVTFEDDPVKVVAYSGFFLPHMTYPIVPFPYLPKARAAKWKLILSKAEESGMPDVIHIHFPLFALAAEVFEEYSKKGVRVVVTEHWTKVLNEKTDRYETEQLIKFLSFADPFMAVGYSLRDAIKDITKTDKKIEIMPNIINDVFAPANSTHEGFVFGVVGRLVKLKQVDKIIEALSETEGAKLIVAGDGKEQNNLKNLAAQKGVEDRVEFTGHLGREETAKVVQGLDCLICFSRCETFGVPVIEAWGCGIPVITTTADCITEKWDDRLGISVSDKDTKALAEAMKKMINNIADYDSEYIERFAREHYSEDSVYEFLTGLYEGGAA